MHRTIRRGTIARGRQDPSDRIRATLGGVLVAGLLTLVPMAMAGAETPPGSSPETARLGNIELDRKARSFRVPGTLARLDPPLEYLAVSRGGIKAYESLLELDVGGAELNAACILIGLEAIAGGQPEFQFDPAAIEGSPVGLAIGWEGETGPVEVPAGRLLTSEGREVGEQHWVYIGSQFAPDGRYLAQDSGTLIGFVHDPDQCDRASRRPRDRGLWLDRRQRGARAAAGHPGMAAGDQPRTRICRGYPCGRLRSDARVSPPRLAGGRSAIAADPSASRRTMILPRTHPEGHTDGAD